MLLAILDTLRTSLRLYIGEVQFAMPDGEEMWVIEPVSNTGERWIAKHSEYEGAVLLLARMVGFDVEDGLPRDLQTFTRFSMMRRSTTETDRGSSNYEYPPRRLFKGVTEWICFIIQMWTLAIQSNQ